MDGLAFLFDAAYDPIGQYVAFFYKRTPWNWMKTNATKACFSFASLYLDADNQ